MTASPVAATTVQFNPEARLFIDGRLRDSSTGKTVDNINPANEQVLGCATDASADLPISNPSVVSVEVVLLPHVTGASAPGAALPG